MCWLFHVVMYRGTLTALQLLVVITSSDGCSLLCYRYALKDILFQIHAFHFVNILPCLQLVVPFVLQIRLCSSDNQVYDNCLFGEAISGQLLTFTLLRFTCFMSILLVPSSPGHKLCGLTNICMMPNFLIGKS